MSIEHLLTRTLQVWRAATVPDGMGGFTTTTAQVGEVAAKVDLPGAAESVLGSQGQSALSHSIFLSAAADVLRGDELRGGGEAFRVISVVGPSRPDYLKALCERIQSEGVT